MKVVWAIGLGATIFAGALFGFRCMAQRDYRTMFLGIAYALAACLTGIAANHV